MSTINLSRWDSAEHLKTDEGMVAYLDACLAEAGDDAEAPLWLPRVDRTGCNLVCPMC